MLYFKLKKALIYALLKQIVTVCAIIEKIRLLGNYRLILKLKRLFRTGISYHISVLAKIVLRKLSLF